MLMRSPTMRPFGNKVDSAHLSGGFLYVFGAVWPHQARKAFGGIDFVHGDYR